MGTIDLIKEAMLETNETADRPIWEDITEDTEIFGVIQSIDLVTLIYLIEDKIKKRLDRDVHIVTEKAYSVENSPFKTVGSFAEFLEEL